MNDEKKEGGRGEGRREQRRKGKRKKKRRMEKEEEEEEKEEKSKKEKYDSSRRLKRNDNLNGKLYLIVPQSEVKMTTTDIIEIMRQFEYGLCIKYSMSELISWM